MRLSVFVLAATLAAPAVQAQSVSRDEPSGSQDSRSAGSDQFTLPVSIENIRAALERPTLLSLQILSDRPTFRVQIVERQRIEELLASLNFKPSHLSAGGVYWDEVQRQMWPSVDNPLQQPYAPFSGSELVTIAVENIAGKLGGGKLMNAISNASRRRAEATARDEVLQAIQDYCNAQPGGGTGIQICATTSVVR
jgi:hypothetical protein